MKTILLFVLTSGILSVTAFAQNGPRIFDNFDRSQGVKVYVPPPTMPAKAVSRPRKGSKWSVKTDDKLIKPTGRSVPVLAVTDGLSHRESLSSFGGSRLSMGTATHLNGFTTGNALHDSLIVDSSRRYGIDPLLIYSQMHQESSFKIRATSYKGASGLMQLMPATARRFGVTQIYDPKQNIDAGVRYMRWLLDLFGGDVVLALAGYNAGEGAVLKYGGRVPPYRETQEYVRRISSRYASISNRRSFRSTRSSVAQTASNVEQKDSRPLAVYEPDPITIRTKDGKMMLVNQ